MVAMVTEMSFEDKIKVFGFRLTLIWLGESFIEFWGYADFGS